MKSHSPKTEPYVPVAVIGIGCFFPKAAGLKQYWRLLSQGQDAIDEVPPTHWSAEDYFDPDPKKPDHIYCTRGGYLSPVDFDPSEYGIPPNSLEATDTSQLLGLTAAKAALNDAGYGDDRDFDRQRVSVILGITGTQELVIPLGARLGHPIWRKALEEAGIQPEKTEEVLERISDGYVSWQESSFPGLLGNVVAGRITNRLNLGGTNCVVDAACASSMSAMHMGLLELKSGRCDMLVTGGVDTLNDIFMHMCFSKTPILSPTGDIRPFSSRADGSILGEGVGLVVLKRLEDAERDDDRIYAVIRSLGSSSDGKSNSIYAPRAEGQMKALQSAYYNGGVTPDTLELIEAHGTGTRVGDEVEFESLSRVFSGEDADFERGDRKNWCAVGTVKSMIGHTKAAAGAAGLIKTVMSLYHKVLPPTLKIEEPDPRLNIESSPFYLNTHLRPWPASESHPRRAGVSSFGFGGSNFHMLLEEYQKEKESVSWDGSVEIVALSGESRDELQQRLSHFKADVEKGMNDAEIAAWAARTRSEFSAKAAHRMLFVLEKTLDRFENITGVITDAVDLLKNNIHETMLNFKNVFYNCQGETGKLAFVFPGQGSQYVNMGRDAVCCFPEAMKVMELADRSFQGSGRLSGLIFPQPVFSDGEKSRQEEELRETSVAQPSIGAVSMVMSKILQRFGIMPDAACGHSFGELSALCAAGWIDMETFFQLAYTRGKLMGEAGAENPGAMLAVRAPLETIDALIESQNLDVILANRNTPEQGVLSGSVAAVETAEKILTEKNIKFKRLPVSAAFHSSLMADAQQPFADAVNNALLTPTDIPVFANATGDAYPEQVDKAKKLLGDQLLSSVDFVKEIRQLFDFGVRTFVEVGPKPVLTGLIKAILKGGAFHALSVDVSSGRRFGISDLARLLCYLAVLGHPVDLNEWEEDPKPVAKQRMRVPISGANYRSKKKRKAPSKPKTPSVTAEGVPSVQTEKRQTATQIHPSAAATSAQTVGATIEAAAAPASTQSVKRTDTAPQAASHSYNRKKINNKNHQAPPDHPSSPIRHDSTPRAGTHQSQTGKRATMNHSKKLSPSPGVVQANADTGYLSDAFKAVQEGLRAMQSLQMHTAETHKKFLETQAQAGRTLQEIMTSTRQLAEPSINGIDYTPPQRAVQYITESPEPIVQESPPQPSPSAAMPEAEEQPTAAVSTPRPQSASPAQEAATKPKSVESQAVSASPAQTSPVQKTASIAKAPEKPKAAAPDQAAPKPSSNGRGRIEKAMLSVVSDLTGYPSEMLSMNMDIEADLGIDSIKRVEILSSFEEKMPGMPTVSPEEMGRLKTLGQIVDYLVGAKPASASAAQEQEVSAPVETPSAPAPTSAPAGGNVEAVRSNLMEVVSELTGYPTEMLSLDMDIEADLGIDSIKRVEILSSFEEKMPDLPPVSPEEMGRLKTLGQIVDHLLGAMPNDAAPAAAPSQAPEAPAPPTSSAPGTETVETTLLSVVSELTGYPSEMLSLDMDIEADLGIDSIKRVEILSGFEEKMPDLPSVSPEEMGRLKTLGQIVEYLTSSSPDASTQQAVDASENVENPPAEVTVEPVKKKVISIVSKQRPTSTPINLPTGCPVFITEDKNGLGKAVAAAFESKGIKTVLARPSELLEWNDLYQVGGLVILADAWEAADDRMLKDAFALTRDLGKSLLESAGQGGAFLGTVTRMDGAFGFKKTGFERPQQGGLAGLVKTASIEWQNVCCHALDIAPDWAEPSSVAESIVDELLCQGPVEIGLFQNERVELELIPAEYEAGDIRLGKGDVVVITGGARGVTAVTALALAKKVKPTLILIGRSLAPSEEPEWLASAGDEAAMKRAILQNELNGQAVSPAVLEEYYRKYKANRDVLTTLKQIESEGATVVYRSADVRDMDAIKTVMDEIRAEYGDVKAVIHGAGILEDRFILEKTDDQFENVFDTKVKGLEALIAATANDPLNYLILFSSVAGRMGNKGQVDYAVANEVLNKTAQYEALKRRDCRVISFNWGPWDGGMVTPSLKKAFERSHIELIPLDQGAAAMLAEMQAFGESPVEVVIGAGLEAAEERDAEETPSVSEITSEQAPENKPPVEAPPALSLSFAKELNQTDFPILNAHQPNGRPAVPFSLMTEWLGHGALHNNPGLFLHGLDRLELIQSVEVEGVAKPIHLMAGKTTRQGNVYEVDVELRDGKKNGKDVIHSRAKAILTDMPVQPPNGFTPPADIRVKSYDRDMEELYETVLFRGERLRGIREIMSCSDKGMVAKIMPAPSPDQWMTEPVRSQWIGDPLVMDSALQMMAVWFYEQKNKVVLPGYADSYRQYCRRFPEGIMTAVLSIEENSEQAVVGDITFLDGESRIVARLAGCRAAV